MSVDMIRSSSATSYVVPPVRGGTPHLEPWDIEWTPERVGRFWDWWANKPGAEGNYFAKRNGRSILHQVRKYTSLDGTIVDLGAGPGFMVEYLLQRGNQVLAVDLSPESIAQLNQRFLGRPGFLGARVSSSTEVPVADEGANVVMLIETVEHLSDSVLDGVLCEARRILAPGGRVIVTTPFEENLDRMKMMCPNCACLFHTYQHMRSWTVRSMETCMHQHGFETIVCRPTLFSFLPRYLWPCHRLMYRLLGRRPPHLLYIGQAV